MLSRRTFTQGIAASAISAANLSSAAEIVVDDPAIREILRHRVDVQKRGVGMAVCVVTPRRKRFVTWGRERLGDSRSVSGDTVFEIGSITKVFTALLLANMTRRGEVALDDPVARHLPADFQVAKINDREITLADLAAHTSGLPRAPDFGVELFSIAWRESFAKYTVAEFKTWVAESHPLPPPDAGGWWYSNAGYALLGMALSHRAGKSFEQLMWERVIEPVGMPATDWKPSAAMQRRLAEGHAPDLTPVPPIALGLFAPAGALLSTPRDLARFARAILPGSGSRIEADAQLLLTVRKPAPWIGGEQALGWEVRRAPGGSFVTKDGVTWGQTASMVFDPTQRVAVIVMSNTHPDLRYSNLSSGGVGAADIAHHLLRPQIPMEGANGTRY